MRGSSPGYASATPPHPRWEAGTAREKDVKPKSAKSLLVLLMEVGDLGHHGIPALLPVVEESRTASVPALTLFPNMEERIVMETVLCLECATNRTALLMDVSPTHASLGQNASASPMAPSNVASVHLATVETASPAKTLMSVKQSLMLATHITESIAVRTLNLVTTVCPALHVSRVLSPLEEEWKRQLLKNRFANPVTHARMVATTAIKMQTASTWASTPSPCSAVSASLGMLGMVIFVERTATWMDGQTLT